MKILVLGSSGMAGHIVSTYLQDQGHDVDTLASNIKLNPETVLLDLTKKEEFENFLDSHKYDAIINCVGILVEQSEKRKDLSTYLNSFLPHFLEQRYIDSETKIIHLSTDCVFSGKTPPYKENSFQDGELFYDKTKALGELNNNKDLTFRMSIIGPDMLETGIGLFNWFYKQSGEISGYSKAMWTGVTTIKLAEAINEALKQNLVGLYHLVPKNNISKLDLLLLFQKSFNRDDITIIPKDLAAADKTLINTRKDFAFEVPDYDIMINEMREWVDSHKTLYPHYFYEK